jgi:hypothetical protein
MRRNTAAVIRAFERRQPARPAASIWTDGEAIYSYNTCLLARDVGGLVLNRTSYSVTTSNHQTSLAVALRPQHVLHGLGFGVSPADLLRAARREG